MAGRTQVGQVPTASLLNSAIGTATGIAGTFSMTTIPGTSTTTLLVSISTQDSNDANLPVTSVTFSGSALTKAAHQRNGQNDTNAELWYLHNPPIGAANVVVSTTGNVWKGVVASQWSGIPQTTPNGTSGTSGTAAAISNSISAGSVGGFVIDVASHKPVFTSIPNSQYLVRTVQGQSFEHVTNTYKFASAPGSVSMSQTWSSSNSYSHLLIYWHPNPDVKSRAEATNRVAATNRTLLSI